MENAVEVENLSFNYPDGHQALVDINLVIPLDQSVALIGPNGAGKSTLLLHLNGILRSKGIVRILGIPIEEKNLKWIRSKVGLVFQEPDDQLFSPTVFDDIAFGPINMMLAKDKIKASVEQALSEVSMQGAAQRASHHLSFGEKKRVSIATVMSMKPDILVLDEPTSNLDPKGRKELIALLKSINKTKIIASHDLDLIAELCSQYVFLDKGTIVKSNPLPADIRHLFSD